MRRRSPQPEPLRRTLLLLLALLGLLALVRCDQSPTPPPAPRPSITAPAPPRPPTTHAPVGFRSSARLDEHYEKHGHEFGTISKQEYLERAQRLRDASPGGDILELARPDGVVTRFDRRSGAFLAFEHDGTIRTFFRPNDGESYFRRQARRRHG